MYRILIASFLVVPLVGCNWLWGTTPPPDSEGQESSRAETKNVIYRGRLMPLGTSIYMEGSHRLELEDGRFVLLESNSVILEDYVGKDVEVFGSTRATVEAGGIIMRVERIAELSGSSSESSVAMSEASSAVSSVAMSVVSIPASSVRPVQPSSAPVVSSVAAAQSSAGGSAVDAKVEAMAKANMSASNWTQQYCSPSHLAFCFPVHKNWWYTSFGATSSSQWHVEVGPTELEALGDGPLSVVLLSGPTTVADGQVTVEGGMAIGQRSWTNNRHFEVRAPAALEQAVRYITQELKPAPTAQ